MNYHKLVAMKLSVLRRKDQRWLLEQLGSNDSEQIKVLIKEFSTLNKNKQVGAVSYFFSWFDREHLQNEIKLDELDYISNEISQNSDDSMACVVNKMPSQLRSLLFESESWKWLAYENELVSFDKDDGCNFLSKKMRESMLTIIYSGRTQGVINSGETD